MKHIITNILTTFMVSITILLSILCVLAMLPFGIVIALLNQEKNHDAG